MIISLSFVHLQSRRQFVVLGSEVDDDAGRGRFAFEKFSSSQSSRELVMDFRSLKNCHRSTLCTTFVHPSCLLVEIQRRQPSSRMLLQLDQRVSVEMVKVE